MLGISNSTGSTAHSGLIVVSVRFNSTSLDLYSVRPNKLDDLLAKHAFHHPQTIGIQREVSLNQTVELMKYQLRLGHFFLDVKFPLSVVN